MNFGPVQLAYKLQDQKGPNCLKKGYANFADEVSAMMAIKQGTVVYNGIKLNIHQYQKDKTNSNQVTYSYGEQNDTQMLNGEYDISNILCGIQYPAGDNSQHREYLQGTHIGEGFTNFNSWTDPMRRDDISMINHYFDSMNAQYGNYPCNLANLQKESLMLPQLQGTALNSPCSLERPLQGVVDSKPIIAKKSKHMKLCIKVAQNHSHSNLRSNSPWEF